MNGALQFVSGYRRDDGLRASLNALVWQAFGLDFEPWYQRGHWDDRYVPHSFVADGQIVANVSTTAMTLLWLGVPRRAVQVGTVVTAPTARGRGLAADLMGRVLARYREECDFFFLFAHEGAVGFYPRFGFQPMEESCFSTDVRPGDSRLPLRQLHLNDREDERLVDRLVRTRLPVSRAVSALDNDGLLWFHLLNACPHGLWYAPQEDCLLVCGRRGDVLLLHDVLCPHEVDLPRLLPALVPGGVARVEFGFTPDWLEGMLHCRPLADNGTLFLLPPPAMDRPFRFPATAQA